MIGIPLLRVAIWLLMLGASAVGAWAFVAMDVPGKWAAAALGMAAPFGAVLGSWGLAQAIERKEWAAAVSHGLLALGCTSLTISAIIVAAEPLNSPTGTTMLCLMAALLPGLGFLLGAEKARL